MSHQGSLVNSHSPRNVSRDRRPRSPFSSQREEKHLKPHTYDDLLLPDAGQLLTRSPSPYSNRSTIGRVNWRAPRSRSNSPAPPRSPRPVPEAVAAYDAINSKPSSQQIRIPSYNGARSPFTRSSSRSTRIVGSEDSDLDLDSDSSSATHPVIPQPKALRATEMPIISTRVVPPIPKPAGTLSSSRPAIAASSVDSVAKRSKSKLPVRSSTPQNDFVLENQFRDQEPPYSGISAAAQSLSPYATGIRKDPSIQAFELSSRNKNASSTKPYANSGKATHAKSNNKALNTPMRASKPENTVSFHLRDHFKADHLGAIDMTYPATPEILYERHSGNIAKPYATVNNSNEHTLRTKSPSPTPILAPPPSPADTRKIPKRQSSASNLFQYSGVTPVARLRSKSTSETAQPMFSSNILVSELPKHHPDRTKTISAFSADKERRSALKRSPRGPNEFPRRGDIAHKNGIITIEPLLPKMHSRSEVQNQSQIGANQVTGTTELAKNKYSTPSENILDQSTRSGAYRESVDSLKPMERASGSKKSRSPSPLAYEQVPKPASPPTTSIPLNTYSDPPLPRSATIWSGHVQRRQADSSNDMRIDESHPDATCRARISAHLSELQPGTRALLPETPLHSDIHNRLSMLRRITTSPYGDPQTSDLSKDSFSQSFPQSEDSSSDAPTDTFAPDPLYMTLTDALSRPYPDRNGPASREPLDSWNQESGANDGEFWALAGEPTEDHPGVPKTSSPVIPQLFSNMDATHEKHSVRQAPIAFEPTQRSLKLDKEPPAFTSVASDLSSLLSERCLSEGSSSISGAAEELFKSLGGPLDDPQSAGSNYQWGSSDGPSHMRTKFPTVDSTCERRLSNFEQLSRESNPQGTWRETLTEDIYQSLLARYNVFEMRRQEVIWELCRSEEAFVETLHVALKLFVQPLRTENGTQWIPGLDPSVAKVFDWLDDISQLHTDVLNIMQGCRQNQIPIVTQIGESLRPFVSRLEIYQPYLVRAQEASDLITRMVQDPQNDFGEFVRIQTSSPECLFSLARLLHIPVERVLNYPNYFKQIFALTPRSHPDHLSMFSLLHGTDMMIRVLQTVKNREEEYVTVKMIAARIRGIPPHFNLADRERRLLAQGPLMRIQIEKDEEAKDHGALRGINHIPAPQNRPSTFRSRPFNARPELSVDESTDESFSFTGDSLDQFRPDSEASTNPGSLKSDLLPFGDSRTKTTSKWIYAFVFTDVVVLANHVAADPSQDPTGHVWELLPDVGIARVLGFTDLSGGQHEHLIGVELLPLEHNRATPSRPSALPVYLSMAEHVTGRMALAPLNVVQEARKRWSSAFSRCYVYTMRSLAFPASYNSRAMYGANADSIMSVLASDKPLPKSPSLQILNQALSAVEQERGERNWWAARFQQVLTELSSRDDMEDTEVASATPHSNERLDPWEMITDNATPARSFGSRPMSMLKESKQKLLKLKR